MCRARSRDVETLHTANPPARPARWAEVMVARDAPRMVKQSAPGAVWTSFFLYLLTALWPLMVAPVVWFLALEPTSGGDRQAGLANATSATINAVIAVVQIVVVFLMRAGHRWARVVLVALTVISVLGVSIAGIFVGFTGLLGVGVSVVTILAAVFMFTPAANGYFRRRTQLPGATSGTQAVEADRTHE